MKYKTNAAYIQDIYFAKRTFTRALKKLSKNKKQDKKNGTI